MAESTRRLLKSEKKILEIALEYQFSNPETYSRAFRRVFGILPSELRRDGRFDRRHLMPKWTPAHLQHINKGPSLLPEVKEWESSRVAGLMILVQEDIGVLPKLWDWFRHELERLGAPISTGDFYGISLYSEDSYPENYLYMAGVELMDSEEVGGALVVKPFPAMKVARFIHKGSLRERHLTLDYAYHAWLPRSGQQLSFPWVIESLREDAWQEEDSALETALYIPIQ